MLETREITVEISILTRQDLAEELNKKLREITRKGGELNAYTLISKYEFSPGKIEYTFLATFKNLDSDIGVSGKFL